jgi:hypothetical protein
LPERLPLLRHHIREQQRIQDAVALGEKAAISNATGFFSTNQDFLFHHKVSGILKAD